MRDVVIAHRAVRKFPICMAFSACFEKPMGRSPRLQHCLAMPNWAYCSNVVLWIREKVDETAIIGNIKFPNVRTLAIKGFWAGRIALLPNPVLLQVLQLFPGLESLELFRISQVSKHKLSTISRVH